MTDSEAKTLHSCLLKKLIDFIVNGKNLITPQKAQCILLNE